MFEIREDGTMRTAMKISYILVNSVSAKGMLAILLKFGIHPNNLKHLSR